VPDTCTAYSKGVLAFFLQPLTVLTRKQDKAVRAINKYVYEWIVILKTSKVFVDWVGAEIPHFKSNQSK